MNKKKLIGPFKQIATLQSTAIKGPLSEQDLDIVKNGGIVIGLEGQILEVDDYETLSSKYLNQEIEISPTHSDAVAIPGLIDAHTHICFAGSRSNDYALRNAGKSYLEIAKAGGGIWDTVSHTRDASLEDLTSGIITRANRMLSLGITTIEVKSGYGLNIKEELKMLHAIKAADQSTTQDLIATCLAAHIKPKDFEGDHSAYLDLMINELFPILKHENLTNRVDAFIEEEAFSKDIIQKYFASAKKMGFDITVHADQFHCSGSQVAIDFEALSADHLEASGPAEINALAKSDVIAMALPGASIGLGCAFTPARKILDQGGALAIASDWNPGSAPMGNLLSQAAILGSFQKLTNAEVLAGITCRAAAALGLSNTGKITKGASADIAIFNADDINEIFYKQGALTPDLVYKNGEKIVFSKEAL